MMKPTSIDKEQHRHLLSAVCLGLALVACGSSPAESDDSDAADTDAAVADVGGATDTAADSLDAGPSDAAPDLADADIGSDSEPQPADARPDTVTDAADDTGTDTETDTSSEADTDDDTSPELRRGLAYAGEAERGVSCHDEICGEGLSCCHGVTTDGCFAPGSSSCGWLDYACDGPEDCGGNDVCCAVGELSTSFTGSSRCMAATECLGPDTYIACASDDDCGAGSCVRGFTVLLTLDIGWCQDAPASDCVVEPGGDCRGDDISESELTGLDGSGADFSGADLSGSLMRRFDGTEALFDGATLERTLVVGSEAAGASFARANLERVVLNGTNLAGATFDEAFGNRPSISECPLDDASFVGASLQGGSFNRGSAARADFTNADLTDATFFDIDLTGAVFEDAMLDGITWGRCICPDGVFVEFGESCEPHLLP